MDTNKQDNNTFPISIGEILLKHTDNGLKMYWHQNLDILYTKNDSIEYMINGYKFIADKGDIILINPKQVHLSKVQKGVDVTSNFISMNYNFLHSKLFDKADIDYLWQLSKGKILLPNLIHKCDPLYVELKDLFNKLIKSMNSSKFGKELLIKAIMYEIIYLFLQNGRYYQNDEFRRKKELEDNTFIRETINYIHASYSENISLDMISEHVNVSKFHLCREFKEETGQTVNNYLKHYRLIQATELLNDTNADITTISYDVGFNNTSYFIAKFKEIYKMTPNQYRKQIKSDS